MARLYLTVAEEFEKLIFYYENRYSEAVSRIAELENDLTEARDTIDQMVEGTACEWDT